MRVLGLDPGFAIIGFAVLEAEGDKLIPLTYGTIRTASDLPHQKRLKIIYDDLTHIIEKYRPKVAVLEKLYFNTNVTTAIKVGEARGVMLLALAQAGIHVCEYTPIQVKQTLVGYGRADKKQVQYMVKMQLGLEDVPKPDDAADACAVAITFLSHRRDWPEFEEEDDV